MTDNWRQLGDTTLAVYEAEFRRRGSPLLPFAKAIYDVVKGDSLLFLAHLGMESEYATTGIAALHPEWHNAVGTRPRGQDGYQRFASWADNAREWTARVHDPSYAYAGTTTLAEYIHTYAPNGDGANNEAEYVAFIRDYVRRFGSDDPGSETGGTMAGAQVLLVMGHRNTTEGDPGEMERTPKFARAYRDALKAAGHKAEVLQEIDGDADSAWTAGNLDRVGQLCAAWMARTPGDNLLMIDCHLAASNEPRGIFAIVPDNDGLQTAIAAGRVSWDVWENNPKDVELAHLIAAGISKATGISQRQCRELGVMSETQTGVASEYNARLAMFAYTAPHQQRGVRLVVEHGALYRDAEFNDRGDFPQKCAAAVVEAVNKVFGSPKPAEPPKTEYRKPLAIPNPGYQINDLPKGTQVHAAKDGVKCRAWAELDAPETRAPLNKGDVANVGKWIKTGNGTEWLLGTGGSRMLAADFVERFEFERKD